MTPSLSWSVSERVKLGNYLASNKQWSNSIVAFTEALDEFMKSSVSDGVSLNVVIPGLRDALREHGMRPVAARGAPPPLQQLSETQQKISGFDLKAKQYISSLPSSDGKRFTVVYFDAVIHTLGELAVTIPTGKSFSFVVVPHDEDVQSAFLTPLAARQLSYIVAHVGWAWVSSTMLQYYQGQILLDNGIPAILSWAAYYLVALRLNSANDWALAHLADVYRDIANGWPGSIDSLAMPEERVDNYVRSLVLFQAAIDINPRAFWAHAHFGAAIVNVRAFVGPLENTTHVPQALAVLLEKWFGRSPNDNPIHNDLAFIDKAIELLTKAQEVTTNYYPWAEAYYADALLVKALILGLSAPDSLGLLGMLETLTAFWLDPRMMTTVFNPGGLTEGGFFSPALVCYQSEQLTLAWHYTRLGMGRLFKNEFIPGLAALFGCQLLANIAGEYLRPPEEGRERKAKPVFSQSNIPDWQSNIPDWIPPEPISSREDLIGFIDKVSTRVFKKYIQFWLGSDIKLNTSLHTSLLQCKFTFVNFRNLLQSLEPPAAEPHIKQLEGFILDIGTKLNVFPTDQSHVPDVLHTYTHSLHDMHATFWAGKPSYHMSKAFAALKRKR